MSFFLKLFVCPSFFESADACDLGLMTLFFAHGYTANTSHRGGGAGERRIFSLSNLIVTNRWMDGQMDGQSLLLSHSR